LLRTERGQQQRWPLLHRDDLLFLFVVSGSATLVDPAQHGVELEEGSSAAVPAGEDYAIDDARPGTCLLELRSRRPGPAATSA
jgi:mannose-6-phosphate isomerase-like protein (cupin superfamily)